MWFCFCLARARWFPNFPEKFPPKKLCPTPNKNWGVEGGRWNPWGFPTTVFGFFDRPTVRCQLLTLGAGNAWALQRSTSILVRETRWGRFTKKRKGYILMWTLSEISETCIMLVVSIFDFCLILFRAVAGGRISILSCISLATAFGCWHQAAPSGLVPEKKRPTIEMS